MASAARAIEEPDPLGGMSLPGWLYHDAEYHGVEMARVMRPAWQIVCHESDIAEAGEWRTLDWIGESAIVIRGADRRVRAFHNVCRHRGSRIVDGGGGCARKLVCPYHAWVYEADGRLTGIPERADYPGIDLADNGLLPIELERWHGFLFVRLEDGGPSVAAMMAPYEAEIAPYRLEDVRAVGPINLRPRAVNWKNVGDNYSDALHIPVGHPGLTRLLGRSYAVESSAHVDKLWGIVTDRSSANISERAYQHFLPHVAHLPADNRRLWLYLKLWPNTALEFYPDQIDFMQWLPVSPTQTVLRDVSYALPGASREMRAARYLNTRINRLVNAEDHVLIARVQAGMESGAYRPGPLSTNEPALRAFASRIRRLIPEAQLPHPPAPGWSRRPALAAA
jgi:phenylpropionate dioxygenase-like ring-hydroxylating dioxygenase large terminal subunit